MHSVFFAVCLLLGDLQNREDIRFVHSAEQGYDTSCGLSALACFLNLYWEDPADEVSLATEHLATKRAKYDFTVSFSDIKRILESRGFMVGAYKMDFSQLEKTAAKYAPIIVHYNEPDGHFALVLDIKDGRVVTADPAEGTVERDRRSFEKSWSGYVMLATKPGKTPQMERISAAVALARGRRELAEAALFPSSLGLARW